MELGGIGIGIGIDKMEFAMESRARLPVSPNPRTSRIPNSVANVAGSTPWGVIILRKIGLPIFPSPPPASTRLHSMPLHPDA